MKIISCILGILILVLTVQPCSDGNNIEDLHKSELHENHHNHNQDSDDLCSPFCVCACCSVVITFKSAVIYQFQTQKTQISTKVKSLYRSNYLFNYLSSIWHPPKK